MRSSKVLLVSQGGDLLEEVKRFLQPNLQDKPLVTTYTDLNSYLTSDGDGLLIALVESSQHEIELGQLIRNVALRQLPVSIVAVAGPEASISKELQFYLLCHLTWPFEKASLKDVLVSQEEVSCPFLDPSTLSLEQKLQYHLERFTPSLLPMAERLALAAQHEVNILLTGETGCGKTFLAHLIHDLSPRGSHRFLHISCGALASNLLESEFFGHVRGAFTGADRPKIGKFAAVGQGTLLLDEIDTLALEHQVKLLRVIETGEFEPVGGNDTEKCDARLIVASNIDLEEAVACGEFRADLYFRLNVMAFHLAPLRERLVDIPPLARNMAARFSQSFRKPIFSISSQAMATLESFSWPGNLRQLENAIQHAVLVSKGPEIQVRDLPEPVKNCIPLSHYSRNTPTSLHQQRDVTEKVAIQRALVVNGYSRSRTADELGISRVTLYKKMKKYGLLSIPMQSSARTL